MKYKYAISVMRCRLKNIEESIDDAFDNLKLGNDVFLNYIIKELKFIYYELSKLDSYLLNKIFTIHKKNRLLILAEMKKIDLLHARIRAVQKTNDTIKDHGLMNNIQAEGYQGYQEAFYDANELIVFSSMVATTDDIYREVGMKIIDQNHHEYKYVFYKYFDGCIDSDIENIRRAIELNTVIQLANLELIARLRQETTVTTSIDYDFRKTNRISELLATDNMNTN